MSLEATCTFLFKPRHVYFVTSDIYIHIWFSPYLQFDRDGYAIIEDFLTDEEVQSLRTEMANIMNNLDPNEHRSVFRTEDQVTVKYEDW